MVAPFPRFDAPHQPRPRGEAPSTNGWRLVDHFDTVEEAEACIEQLRRAGVDARLTLIDGLSVLARRVRPLFCHRKPH